jgi:hypothetical protein
MMDEIVGHHGFASFSGKTQSFLGGFNDSRSISE